MASPDYIAWPSNGPYFDKQHPLAQGCVGAWCFHPNWHAGAFVQDISTKRERGTLDGAFSLPDDWTGHGISIRSGTRRVTVGTSPLLHGKGAYSICAAFTPDASRSLQGGVYDEDNTGGTIGPRLILNTDGTMAVGHMYNTSNWAEVTSTAAVSDKKLNVAVGTWDAAGTGAIYVNSQAKSQGGLSTNWRGGVIEDLTGNFRNNTYGYPFEGRIAVVMIHNKVLPRSVIESFMQDPFRLFRRKKIAYFFYTAAPAGGTPMHYYARRRAV